MSFKFNFRLFILSLLVFVVIAGPEEDEGVKYADHCEACKILAIELQGRLTETGKSHDVLELGYVFLFHTNTCSLPLSLIVLVHNHIL